MWVQFLNQEDPLEEGMATHSSILAWRIPWTEEPGGLQSTRVTKSQTRLKGLSSSMCKIFYRCVVKYLYMNIRHQKQNHKARCLSPEGEIQVCVCVCLCGTHICMCPFSHVQLSVTPWTVAHQAPLSMGFSRQEYWSELPFPSPGDLSDPGIKPPSLTSPALAGGFFTPSATWKVVLLK